MNSQDFKALHELVWTYRHEVEEYWCVPSLHDCFRFSACESTEIIDALLRQNPQYRRNHIKSGEVAHEASQTAIMLLTALGEEFDWTGPQVINSWAYWLTSYQTAVGNGYLGTQADWIAGLVSDAHQEALWPYEEGLDPVGYSEGCAVQALVELGQIDGVDLAMEVETELKRIKANMEAKDD